MKRLSRDEKGLSHLLLILIILVVLAVIGYAGWKVMKKGNSTTSTKAAVAAHTSTATSKAVESSCMTTYHDTNLCKFAAHSTLDKVAYKATLKVTDTQGAVSSMTLSADGKGNTSLSSTGNGGSIDSISLDNNTYIKDASSGTWIEYSSGSSAPTQTDPASNLDVTVGKDGITFKSEGKAACGSLTCFKYQVTDSATPTATQTVLFDTSDYLLREWDYSTPSDGTTVMTLSYPSVNITAPSPVQKFSVGQ